MIDIDIGDGAGEYVRDINLIRSYSFEIPLLFIKKCFCLLFCFPTLGSYFYNYLYYVTDTEFEVLLTNGRDHHLNGKTLILVDDYGILKKRHPLNEKEKKGLQLLIPYIYPFCVTLRLVTK